MTRILKEAGLADNGAGKHQLALRQGFAPADDQDRSHLNRLDSWTREHHIFADDKDCYQKLKKASDLGVEVLDETQFTELLRSVR